MRAIHSYTYEDQGRLVVNLARAIRKSGGQLLREEPLSEHAFGMELELPLNCIIDLYGELVRSGLEFSRSGQSTLAELCTVQRHVRPRQARDLVHAIASGAAPSPSFADGLQVQRVLAAVEESAEKNCVYTPIAV